MLTLPCPSHPSKRPWRCAAFATRSIFSLINKLFLPVPGSWLWRNFTQALPGLYLTGGRSLRSRKYLRLDGLDVKEGRVKFLLSLRSGACCRANSGIRVSNSKISQASFNLAVGPQAVCSACGGTGARHSRHCPHCGGHGVQHIHTPFGVMRVSRPPRRSRLPRSTCPYLSVSLLSAITPHCGALPAVLWPSFAVHARARCHPGVFSLLHTPPCSLYFPLLAHVRFVCLQGECSACGGRGWVPSEVREPRSRRGAAKGGGAGVRPLGRERRHIEVKSKAAK